MPSNRQQKAFYRKLLIAHLIDTSDHNLASLVKETGMPRRTLQDAIADFSDIGIAVHFAQSEGSRHNQGFYRLDSWGPINPSWVVEHLDVVKTTLGMMGEAPSEPPAPPPQP